jgi:hypothetical protein
VALNNDKDVKNKEALTQGLDEELKTSKTFKSIRRFQKHFANNLTKEL